MLLFMQILYVNDSNLSFITSVQSIHICHVKRVSLLTLFSLQNPQECSSQLTQFNIEK